MRVIAGEAKGRRLFSVDKPEMRPTTDRARQVIFDILGDIDPDTRVLDLFAGVGGLGIEALSRGAREAVFVEQDRDAAAVIARNLDATRLAARGAVRRADVLRYLAPRARTPFDLVFLDPPYSRGLGFVSRVVGMLSAGDWVRPGGTVVAEAEVGRIAWPSGFRETRTRRFGRTQVSMAVRDDDDADGDLSGDV